MVCEGYHHELAPDRNGDQRNAIVFELRPLEAVVQKVEEQPTSSTASLEELRKLAYAAAETSQKPSQGKRNIYQRSNDVRIYVLARANGNCEGCTAAAPFLRLDGSPYLEPHHLRRLSDGGPDHPAHVIALCPNCHRRVHFGADGKSYNDQLTAVMATIEVKSLVGLKDNWSFSPTVIGACNHRNLPCRSAPGWLFGTGGVLSSDCHCR